MLRIFVDQDFDHNILRGLRLRIKGLDAVTALEVGLNQDPDSAILAWAAEQERVVLAHDCKTMPAFAYSMVISCSEPGEWAQYVLFLPLKT
jgi:hypothetical protein